MAISLGLHQEVIDPTLNEMTREHRRRLWWSVYSMDRFSISTLSHSPTAELLTIQNSLCQIWQSYHHRRRRHRRPPPLHNSSIISRNPCQAQLTPLAWHRIRRLLRHGPISLYQTLAYSGQNNGESVAPPCTSVPFQSLLLTPLRYLPQVAQNRLPPCRVRSNDHA